MGIPLVRNNSVDDINTSIIAIKKELGKGGSGDMGDVNVNVKYEVTDTVEDGNSLPVTSNGVSRVINVLGVPVGCILSFYGNTVPESFLPCNGVAFDENQYPALYALLGDNHTPYSYDKSRLGEWESFTLTTTNQEMSFDGYLLIKSSNNCTVPAQDIYVNDTVIGTLNFDYGQGGSVTAETTIPFRKGDNIRISNTTNISAKVAYYTHFNVIKATSGLEEIKQANKTAIHKE